MDSIKLLEDLKKFQTVCTESQSNSFTISLFKLGMVLMLAKVFNFQWPME